MSEGDESVEGEEERDRFDSDDLDWAIVSRPLLEEIKQHRRTAKTKDARIPVVIDLNFKYYKGLTAAKARTRELIKLAARRSGYDAEIARTDPRKERLSQQYLFATLEPDVIETLAWLSFRAQEKSGDEAIGDATIDKYSAADADDEQETPDEVGFIFRPVFMIWPDFEIKATTLKSISTVKADAAHRAFSALGEEVVWAVLDSGIDGEHVHFSAHANLEVDKLDPPLRHMDFTNAYEVGENGDIAEEEKTREWKNALTDGSGHGTHVAGIIAGAVDLDKRDKQKDGESAPTELRVATRRLNEKGKPERRTFPIKRISGMAPCCKIVSFKVLGEDNKGPMSNLLAALAQIQEINEHGRWLKIHGINMSVGYDFKPEWFACGQSPLCLEVNRLVKSGVVVVAAAGNTGYGFKQSVGRGAVAAGMLMSINDPGNADLAITVGSTHREMPHVYGVSFFSSKGPTGDGRMKPDLVAPGERIISCAAGSKRAQEEILQNKKDDVDDNPTAGDTDHQIHYVEDSGTSMAAPHVSGVIAAFLSIRREFIGRPEQVKEIFVSNSTDLKRQEYLQGKGLVDLMRTIQAV